MIKKIFDRYYLVLMRGYGEWCVPLTVATIISISITLNFVSLFTFIFPEYILWGWIGLWSAGGMLMLVLDIFVYNKKRREELREKYKDESEESRRHGITWVVAYEVFTVALLVFAVWTFAKDKPLF